MLSQSIEPRTGTIEELSDVINLDTKPEVHGPFPGQVHALKKAGAAERTYEVRHTDRSTYNVIADSIELDIDGSFISMKRGGDTVTIAPLHSLIYIGRLLEDK